MRKNQKGFTLVELLVVIAILAILATVAVVGYTSFIEQANQSVDEQAVTQINRALEALEITNGKFTNVADVIAALDEMDLDVEDYKPLKNGMYFYWDTGLNRVVYADANDNIIFPANTTKQGQWMSLSGIVPLDDSYNVDAGVATITSGAQLAHLMQQASENKAEVTEIVLSESIDLRGAAVNFGNVTSNITISAPEGTTATISGIRTDAYVLRVDGGYFAGDTYGYGLFGRIKEGVTVTIKNVVISDMVVGGAGAKTVGLIAGYIDGTLNMENVTIQNSSVTGYQKIGAITGHLGGTLNLTNVKFENVAVSGDVQVAKIVGCASPTANLTVHNGCDLDGITTKALFTDGQIAVAKSDITGVTLNDNSNTYAYWDNYRPTISGGQTDHVGIFGGATNDWAWYTKEVINVKVNEVDYSLVGDAHSTSKNIVNGVPQE